MKLLDSLKAGEQNLLPVLARFWRVDIQTLKPAEAAAELKAAMLDPDNALRAWESLSDEQRGVLQTLLASQGASIPLPMFERLNGKIRKMGPGAIEREQPLEHPQSHAEALYYRGLVYERYEQTSTGPRVTVYVPPDLAAVLPVHRTGYDDLAADDEDDALTAYDTDSPHIEPLDADMLTGVRPADTTIVDDLTTLLGYLQVHGGAVSGDDLAEVDREGLTPYLLNPEPQRLAFIFRLAVSAELIDVQDRRAFPRRAEARRWLEARRDAQLKALADAWHHSRVYLDLWHVPGLHPEPTGWPYDAVVAREAFRGFVRDLVPPQDWWALDEFVHQIHEEEPDFQRPGGDYDSWYIRNDKGEYLTGFESWDAVEGALLEFYISGPLHWLGMADLAEDAARLTAYGRAFVDLQPWPAATYPEEQISIRPDGTLLVSRRVPRIDRFQVMRFTTWADAPPASDPYTYKLTATGIQQAAGQGITTEHIQAFLARHLDAGASLPAGITRLLDSWQSGPAAAVTIEQLLVLRTTAPETLDFILNTPALRRYVGARLGEMAVVVRADQWQNLYDALGQHGVEVDISGL